MFVSQVWGQDKNILMDSLSTTVIFFAGTPVFVAEFAFLTETKQLDGIYFFFFSSSFCGGQKCSTALTKHVYLIRRNGSRGN